MPTSAPCVPLCFLRREVSWFFKKSDPNWELSNMAGGMPIYWPLEATPVNRWRSSEQLYQACKYAPDIECLPADARPGVNPNVRARIRAAASPRGAKMTQKCADKAGLVRLDWIRDEVRLKAMLWVLELKLFWNQDVFGEALALTGDDPIVEVSRKDDFWGCLPYPGGELRGHNHLGRLLADVRDRHDSICAGKFSHPRGVLLK